MTDQNLVRRLTTILSLDVVAFSTMSARDEERALALLAARLDSAGTLVRQHRGRAFKMTGDGLLAEFASPVEAVRAALEIQEAMRSANATAQADDQLTLRIGVNLGDVVESGDDLMGDAVNVAVRLESISEIGGVCISSSVYEQIVGKLMLGAEDLGEQHLKNIPRSIHAYRLTIDGARPAAAAHPAHAVARSMPQIRLFLVGGVAAVLILGALAGTFYLRHPTPSPSLQTAEPTSASPVVNPPIPETAARPAAPSPVVPANPQITATPQAPAPPAVPPAPRLFAAKEVPFVPDYHWRALQNYTDAPGAKAFALNVRGIFGTAMDRVDEAAARQAALDDCNRKVEREVSVVRAYDSCMLYAVENDVVWSFRPPPMPPAPYVPAARPSPPIAFDPATAPLLGALARERLPAHYLTNRHHRVLVLGHNRFDWWTLSETDADAIRRNLQICGHLTGRPCVVYALNNEVLVRTPQTMRATDIFTPQDIGVALDDAQTKALEQYLVANDWRAVALAVNGRMGIVSGRPSEQDATSKALQACRDAGGSDCAITAIGPFTVAPQ
ncbi:adenylate/guanylate cyclase domain-containing protein [Reyranella sp.]|uniref:adenylate/guanylate cyclase domain-containing protein n=1 Tax=Reyranella sp. TaxID=1929291 RepID=UPI003D10CE25